MTELYKAVLDADSGLWGVEGEDGAILYEADMANEAQARFFAKYHTDHPYAEFERDVWPAWVEHLAATDPYESALLFAETAPQDELVNLIIEYRKLKTEIQEARKLRNELTYMLRISNIAQNALARILHAGDADAFMIAQRTQKDIRRVNQEWMKAFPAKVQPEVET